MSKKKFFEAEVQRVMKAKQNGLLLPHGTQPAPIWFHCSKGHKFDMRQTNVIQAVWEGQVARLCPACLFYKIKDGYELMKMEDPTDDDKHD